MKHILMQILRLAIGLTGLPVAGAAAVASILWVTDLHELAWEVIGGADLSAGLFWALLGGCLAWGLAMVWIQERVMKRPPG